MALKRKPYFYDAQLKRLLVQIMSCFSGYQVQTGNQRDGKTRFLDVPIIYGDMSRAVGYILQGGNDNTMSYLPIMSCYMTGLTQQKDWRTASSQHVEQLTFRERALDPNGEPLVNVPGKLKIIERAMPTPYNVTLDISIWASNNDQSLQLAEQIAVYYREPMDIKLSNSPTDWSFLTSLIFQGDINMEKAVPTGVETDPLYVFTMTFDIIVWLSPPVKVYDATPIYEINVPILELEEQFDFNTANPLDGLVIKLDEDEILELESFS